jgi:maltooligosyltrehalose trehalohydrolase
VSAGRIRIGSALLLVLPYVPLLFAGAEWGASSPFRYFTAHGSSQLARAVRRGRREEFSDFVEDVELLPDPQDPETFAVSKLDWGERDRDPHAGILAWYRQLIALRRATPALRDADREAVTVEHDAHAGWLRVRRGPVTLVANLGAEAVELDVPGEGRLAWPPELVATDGRATIPPDGVIVAEAAG